MGLNMKTINICIALLSMQLYAGIGVGYSGVGALPVELTTFTSLVKNNNVELHWKTATEINNYGFDIQRTAISTQRTADKIWTKVGFVDGNGTTNAPHSYIFYDKNIPSGKYSYRLKQIDRNGRFVISQEIEVTASGIPKEYALEQNYPNPFNPTTVITYSIILPSKVKVEVFTVLGKLITTLVNETKETGSYKINFNAEGLSSGIYYYKIQAGSFAATKKMVVLK